MEKTNSSDPMNELKQFSTELVGGNLRWHFSCLSIITAFLELCLMLSNEGFDAYLPFGLRGKIAVGVFFFVFIVFAVFAILNWQSWKRRKYSRAKVSS